MIGPRIAILRRHAGLSQRELGRQLSVSASTIGMYEQGRREPSADRLVRMAGLFHVTVDYLITGQPENEHDRDHLRAVLFSAKQRLSGGELILRGSDGSERALDESALAELLAATLGD